MNYITKLSKVALVASLFFSTASVASADTVRSDGQVNLENTGYLFNNDVAGKIKLSYDSETSFYYAGIVQNQFGFTDGLNGSLACMYSDSTTQVRRVHWEERVSVRVSIRTTDLEQCFLKIDDFDGEPFAPILAPFSLAATENAKLQVEIVRDKENGLIAGDTIRYFYPGGFASTKTFFDYWVFLKQGDPDNFYNYVIANDTAGVVAQSTVYVLPSPTGTQMKVAQLLRNGQKLISVSTATTTQHTIVD